MAVAVSANALLTATRVPTVASEVAQTTQLRKQILEKGAEIALLNRQAREVNAVLAVLQVRVSSHAGLLASTALPARGAGELPPLGAARSSFGAGTSTHRSPNVVRARPGDSVTLAVAKARAENDRRALREQRIAARHTLDRLTRAQADAAAVIAAQNKTLAHVRSDRTALSLIRKLQKDVQARIASGRAIAAALSAATREEGAAHLEPTRGRANRSHTSARHSSRRRPVAGPYANPLRAVRALTPERVDAGVDYGGSGPVYAIGDGVVLNVYSGGWPNGVFIAYQLRDGPAKGLVVFTAEDLDPQVSVGESVTANTVIGRMFGGPHGIEIGWADGSQIPNAMARSAGQYHGGNSTAFGDNFSRLLQSLGAPGGIVNFQPAGTLPAGWPQW